MKTFAAFAFIAFLVIISNADLFNNNSSKEVKKKEKRNQAISKYIESANDLIQKHNANGDWESSLLFGKDIRSTPILTHELEGLWLEERPIFIYGEIYDVLTVDNIHKFKIRHSLLCPSYNETKSVHFFSKLEYVLDVSQTELGVFLENYPDPSIMSNHARCVGVVAKISSIQQFHYDYTTEYNVESKYVRVGIGELLDVIYLKIWN